MICKARQHKFCGHVLVFLTWFRFTMSTHVLHADNYSLVKPVKCPCDAGFRESFSYKFSFLRVEPFNDERIYAYRVFNEEQKSRFELKFFDISLETLCPNISICIILSGNKHEVSNIRIWFGYLYAIFHLFTGHQSSIQMTSTSNDQLC